MTRKAWSYADFFIVLGYVADRDGDINKKDMVALARCIPDATPDKLWCMVRDVAATMGYPVKWNEPVAKKITDIVAMFKRDPADVRAIAADLRAARVVI
jgi:hypothetical protein